MPALNPLLSAPILPTIVRMSLPNMAAMLASSLVAVAETAYVGQLGIAPLAGMAQVFPLVMLQQMLSSGAMGGGVSSAVSRALGAGQEARAASLALHACVIGAALGLFFTLVLLLFGAPLYRVLGGEGAALQEALAYSNMVFIGVTFIWVSNLMISVLRGCGNMVVPSAVMLGTLLSQALLSGALGLGWFGLPRMGMPGVALGQVLAFAGATLFLFSYLRSGRGRLRLVLRGPLQREMFIDILRVGAMACIAPVQTVLTILVVTALVARFGTEVLAGYGIGSRLEFLLVPIVFAIGVACIPLVGMAIGAGQVARARRVAWTGGVLAGVLLGILGVLVALAPQLWTGLFTKSPAVLEAAHNYLRWVGPSFGPFGLGLCLYFASQGSGKVLGPVLAGTARLAVVAGGGWLLMSHGAEAWSMYALIALGLVVYGLGSCLGVYLTRWGPPVGRPNQ